MCRWKCISADRCIKDFDAFGHDIVLHFDKNGPSHNTLVGGITSLVVYLAILVVVLAHATSNGPGTQIENTQRFYQDSGNEYSVKVDGESLGMYLMVYGREVSEAPGASF